MRSAVGEDGHQGEQRYDREVLHQQDGEGRLAMAAGNLALIPEHLDDEGGGREGEAGADQQSGRPVWQEQLEIQGNDQGRNDDLQRPESEQRSP
jgi:hypothetical protein